MTVFGSARTPPDHPHYELMRAVAAALGRAGFAVITGGGGGVMEAANRGARALAEHRIEPSDLTRVKVLGDPAEVARIVVAAYEQQLREAGR